MRYKAASDWPQVADGHELFDGGGNYVGISFAGRRRQCAPSPNIFVSGCEIDTRQPDSSVFGRVHDGPNLVLGSASVMAN